MKIGIDVKTLSKRYTGIAVYVHEMLRYFAELDKKNEYFLFSNKDFSLDFDLPKNFHTVIYKSHIGSFGVMFKLPRLINAFHIDIFWGPEHIVPILKTNCKIVVTIHDLCALMHPELGSRFNAFLQRYFTIPSIRKSNSVIAISKSTAQDVIKLSGISKNKIEVIYNGDSPYNYKMHDFTESEIKTIRNKYDLQQPYFLFVGSIEPRKNIPTIIKAFNLYKNETGGNEKLVLAGGLGWKYKASLDAIKKSPYKNDIILTGYCSNMEREYFYRNAIVLLFPSLYEGLGLPVIEAFSVGLPVITADNSALHEVGGSYALYIPDATDYEGLACYMKQVTTISFDKRNSNSYEYKKWAHTFSRMKCAEQILELFNNLNMRSV